MDLVKITNLGVMIEKVLIVEWCKKEGDHITRGEVLFRVETEKAMFEVEAEKEGILKYIFFREGMTVDINTTVAVICLEGEDIGSRQEAKRSSAISQALPRAKENKISHRKDIRTGTAQASISAIKIAPRARRIAMEKEIDLSTVEGTGPQGMITTDDVEIYMRQKRIRVAIVNASKGGVMAYAAMLQLKAFEVVGFIDDDVRFINTRVEGLPVLGKTSDFRKLKKRGACDAIFVAIGNNIALRSKISSFAKEAGFTFINIIDKRSILSASISIGENVWIKEGAIIGSNSSIGNNVIIDTACVLSHDIIVGENCHLSPGCTCGGTVRIGDNTVLGVGVCVAPYVSIGSHVIVSPGSSVVHDIADCSIIDGVPGKVIGKSK